VVIRAGVFVRLVILVLGFVFELPKPVYLVAPVFEHSVLTYLAFLVCEPFRLVPVSIRSFDSSGPLVLTVVATFGLLYIVLLALVLVGIGFRRRLGLSQTLCDRMCGCVLFCRRYIVVIIRIQVTAIAVAPHVGRVGFGCGILEVLSVQIAQVDVINLNIIVKFAKLI
jgi:hypothetical protein